MKRASMFTLLILVLMAMKEIWKMKQLWQEEGYGGGRSCKCGKRFWT
jgi:hypothetical protein